MNQNHNQDRELIADLEELRQLLSRLNQTEEPLPKQEKGHQYTVEDVAEALGLDPDEVERQLIELHEEQRDARLSNAIRELEEPLYRVERPGIALLDAHENPLMKLRSVKILADRNKISPKLPRRELEDKSAEKVGILVGYCVLGITLITFLVMMLKIALTK